MGTLKLFYWLLYKKNKVARRGPGWKCGLQKKPHVAVRQNADAENTGLNNRQPTLQIRPSALLYYVRNIRICKGENTIVSVTGSSKTIK